jgi:hypothetical protein
VPTWRLDLIWCDLVEIEKISTAARSITTEARNTPYPCSSQRGHFGGGGLDKCPMDVLGEKLHRGYSRHRRSSVLYSAESIHGLEGKGGSGWWNMGAVKKRVVAPG